MSPYAGVSAKDVKKLDRCIRKVMKGGTKQFKGRSPKSRAVAICRKSLKV